MREVYLDNAATTRCHEEVARLAMEMMTGEYGNPSSLHHKGFLAQQKMEQARGQVAEAVGCQPPELTFTSGGTESNNLAIFGAAAAHGRKGRTLVAMSACHSSVLEPLRQLERQGFTLRLVPPLPDGNADLEALCAAVDGDTILLCCELVGSETGAVTPVAELSRQVRRKQKNLLIHCDAVQGLRKTPFRTDRLGVDTLSVSAHKVAGPKGCGALYLRRGSRITPMLHGGGQEKGLRPGTQNVPLICAFGLAAELTQREFQREYALVEDLRRHFASKLKNLPGICMNSPENATPYICNLSVPGFRSETLLHFLAERGISVSSGSACAGGAASHVLRAMGLPPERVDSALRVSFCPENTTEELDLFFTALQEGMNTLARSRG